MQLIKYTIIVLMTLTSCAKQKEVIVNTNRPTSIQNNITFNFEIPKIMSAEELNLAIKNKQCIYAFDGENIKKLLKILNESSLGYVQQGLELKNH